jgi:hypothetical protein
MAGTFSYLVSHDDSFRDPLQHLSPGAGALLIFVSVILFFAFFLVRIRDSSSGCVKKKWGGEI